MSLPQSDLIVGFGKDSFSTSMNAYCTLDNQQAYMYILVDVYVSMGVHVYTWVYSCTCMCKKDICLAIFATAERYSSGMRLFR